VCVCRLVRAQPRLGGVNGNGAKFSRERDQGRPLEMANGRSVANLAIRGRGGDRAGRIDLRDRRGDLFLPRHDRRHLLAPRKAVDSGSTASQPAISTRGRYRRRRAYLRDGRKRLRAAKWSPEFRSVPYARFSAVGPGRADADRPAGARGSHRARWPHLCRRRLQRKHPQHLRDLQPLDGPLDHRCPDAHATVRSGHSDGH
jgi:hypothetical protein